MSSVANSRPGQLLERRIQIFVALLHLKTQSGMVVPGPLGRHLHHAPWPWKFQVGHLRCCEGVAERNCGNYPSPIIRSGPGKPNQRKRRGQFMNFSQGHSGTKDQCESCLFLLRNKHRNSWTFRFGSFFGLVCRGDSWYKGLKIETFLYPKDPAVLKRLRHINSLSPYWFTLSAEITCEFSPGKQGISETLP